MTKKQFRLFVWSLLAMLGMTTNAMAADFEDFSVDLRDASGGILTSEEAGTSQTITFGIAVNAGVVSRVAADDASAVAVITGKTGNNHGLQNFSATVPVDGSVKITMSTCSWGGSVSVKNAAGSEVVSFSTQKGSGGSGCYGGNGFDDENIISEKYVGDATTLTISGGAYVGFFAVEAVSASAANVSYSLGDVVCQGTIVPTGGTYAIGDSYTIPASNFTLYKEGYTLTGWTDGTTTYAAGSSVTLEGDLALTPVFTANTVSLADRTEPVTIKWNFRRDQGAPVVGWEGATGLVWVAQATVGDQTIDVALPFSTSPGKFNNKNNNDWVQINNGTTFTVPSCKGATISMEAYNEITTTTIDGQSDYTTGKTISYEIATASESVEVVIGDGSYYRYIQVVLPVVASAGGKTYTDEAVTVEWPFNDATKYVDYTVTPDGTFSTVAVNPGDLTITGTATRTADNLAEGIKFIKFKPAGSTTAVQWVAKPATGLTFTPTKVSMWIQRFSTDAENGVTITAKVGTGDAITLGNFTAPRANNSQAADKYGKSSNWTNHVVIELTPEQQAALASGEELTLSATVGVGSTKEGGFSDVIIEGLLNGTVADVNKYTLDVVANPTEGGSVTKYPASDEYEEGSEVTVTATENFGYDFVKWTNAAGEDVSTEAKFKYTVNANETLTANFKKVETYELALTVDGTNDYMVTVSPAPDVVDGKWMYEAGTVVVLTANEYDGLVTFNNWSDGTTSSEKTITMNADTELTAVYAEADIIAGWDFYKAGSSGRKADFASADNESAALSLVYPDGTTSGWLDKSTLSGGGYESFKGAAVNWRNNVEIGSTWWQTKVNAGAFADINVQFQMLYNYNAYQTYNAEYSLDGENWTNFGSITMTGAKAVASFSEKLPTACDNQESLFIRMIADKTSDIDGTESANDGNTLAMFFITGTPKLVDDPVAPALVSSVPAEGATGASATGKIVLTFDKKVQLTTTGTAAVQGDLNGTKLEPVVSGKTVTFPYTGLDYATAYKFTLPANSIENLTGAVLTEAITINFTTMARPAVTKGQYDAVVSNVDKLLAAITEANGRSDKNTRYRIFIKNGEYTIPLYSTMKTCNGYEVNECITFITASNISFIGESRDGVVITNAIPADATFAGTYGTTSKYDGIGNSDVFQINSSVSGLYWQDLTVSTGMEDARGRDLAIQDKGTKNVYKNTKLHGYQDTWTSNNDNGLYYFEGGVIRGRTDYICGKGDIYFNQVEFQQISGGYCAVPSKPAKIGWVMKDCVINGDGDGVDGNYTLGRPWGSGTPVAVWIDTKMNVIPSAIGWNEMSGGWPARFAEYNSTTSTGSVIDLSGRKTIFADTHENNPVLTAEEAAEYSDMANMYGDWQPTLLTEQAPLAADVKLAGNKLTWTGNEYALLYAIVKNGSVVDFTTECEYTVDDEKATYAVRAANEMGGLNDAVEAEVLAEGETFNIAIGEAGYRTFSCSKAIDFSSVAALTVYTAKADTENDKVILEEIESKAIAADQAVVLKGAEGTYAATVAASGETLADNELKIAEDVLTGDGSIYVLNKLAGVVGFYRLATGSTLERGKGYLTVTGTGARMLALSFGDDATGIDSVTRDALDGKAVFDLQGRRVLNVTKGVYVVNGKKIVLK